MPIFRSAYDTTFGRRYSTEPIKAAIVKATVSNYLAKNSDGYTVIEDTSDMAVDIPSFTHPLYVDKAPYDGLYVDARNFVSRNRLTGDKKISSMADYNFLMARAGLEHIWRTSPPEHLRSASPLPASVYASWLSENIAKRLGVEAQDQFKLSIFSAWFYYSLFSDEVRPDEHDFMRICQGISKSLRTPVDVVIKVLDGQDYVKDITDYCSRLEEATGSIRLRGFSSILLYPILNSTWFGASSNDMVAVAIEHVPTFLAITLSATTERAYTRSLLSKMIERVPAKNAINDFVLQMTASLKA